MAPAALNGKLTIKGEVNTESNSTGKGSTSESESKAGVREEPSVADVQPSKEDEALAILQQAGVAAQQIVAISKSPIAAKSRKVALAVVMHARTPRHISVPLLRRMFTFDLMQVSLTPVVASDIKRAAENQILLRAESLTAGEKIALAKRASGRTAAALLQENDARVITPALDNAQMTEAWVVQALMKPHAPENLFMLVSEHRKWSQRREVQIALLRSEKTPIERAKEFSVNFSPEFVREILPESRKSEQITEN